ncbi:MAG: 50S ribosomal protein L31e [Nanoarchaeota archaeon]|nr:50S ribosomal protein L31e [Nanoarchaeota archaeon]
MERIYTIPLRKEFQKAPSYKRTKKAVSAVREFLQKHMKNQEVRIGRYLNMELTARGRKNPPHKVKVNVWTEKTKIKNKDVEIVKAELFGAPKEEPVKTETKKEKTPTAKTEKKEDKQAAIKATVEKLEKKPQPEQQEKATARTDDKKQHDSAKITRAAPHNAQHTTETKK